MGSVEILWCWIRGLTTNPVTSHWHSHFSDFSNCQFCECFTFFSFWFFTICDIESQFCDTVLGCKMVYYDTLVPACRHYVIFVSCIFKCIQFDYFYVRVLMILCCSFNILMILILFYLVHSSSSVDLEAQHMRWLNNLDK